MSPRTALHNTNPNLKECVTPNRNNSAHDDAASQISQAIASVRSTKGRALESAKIMDKYTFFNGQQTGDIKYPEPKSPFRASHHYPVTQKANGPIVEEAYNKLAGSPKDIFDSMQFEFMGPIKEGKRPFHDL